MRLVLCIALLCSPAWATWTLTQVKSNNACSGTTCSVTATSTGSAHLLVAGLIANNSSSVTISSVTSAACTGAWTHAANTAVGANGNGFLDLYYCLNSASGQTAVVITASGSLTAGSIGVIWEASSSLGSIAVDTGATPSSTIADATCTNCAGVSLSLSSNNKFIAVMAGCGAACSNLTGTGFVNDLANPGGDGVGHGINIATSGTLASPTTWTMSSGTLKGTAAAFQEASAGGGSTCQPTMTTTGGSGCG